jgi:hypothetical protein
MTGLRRVRRYKRFTLWLRYPLAMLASLMTTMLSTFRIRSTSEVKVLVWSKESTYHPAVGQSIVRVANDAQHLPFHETKN